MKLGMIRELVRLVRREADRLDRLSYEELIEEYENLGIGRHEIIGNEGDIYRVRDRRRISGYLYASDLGNYGWCLRQVWLREKFKERGFMVTKKQLRALLRGTIVHAIMEDMIGGLHEYELRDWDRGLIGHVDWLILDPRMTFIVDFKTSFQCGFYTYLQMQAYLYLVRRCLGIEKVKSVVIYRLGYNVYEPDCDVEYYISNFRRIIAMDLPPPVLPSKLRSRCRNCSYKARCTSFKESAFSEEELMEVYWKHEEYKKAKYSLEV